MIRRLLILAIAVFGVCAQAEGPRQSEAELGELLRDVAGPFKDEVRFRCFYLGKTQGFTDILANQTQKLMSFTSSKPEAQAAAINKKQQVHVRIDRLLSIHTPVCDSLYRNKMHKTRRGERDARAQINELLKRFKGTSAEDQVVGCFHTGRLDYMLNWFRAELTESASKGKPTTPEEQKMLAEATTLLRKNSGGCMPGVPTS